MAVDLIGSWQNAIVVLQAPFTGKHLFERLEKAKGFMNFHLSKIKYCPFKYFFFYFKLSQLNTSVINMCWYIAMGKFAIAVILFLSGCRPVIPNPDGA